MPTPGDFVPASVSVVVPVYNSEATLELLVGRLERTMDALGVPYELLLVDDGSRDRSWAALEALAGVTPSLRPLQLSRNYGQHNALLAGIRHARYRAIVTLDDDLQNPPEEIPRLLEQLAANDVVYGSPKGTNQTLSRRLASRLTRLALQPSMGAETARSASPFRAFHTRLREGFAGYSGPFVSIDVLLTWSTTRFGAVEVRHDPRHSGKSTYRLSALVTHAMNMLTGFSTFPLQVASLVGFAFAAFGVAVLVYVLGRLWLSGRSVPGFPFLASVVAIFSGAQLFALGIIGEYLARMHFRSMDRPSYLVREWAQPDSGDVPMNDGAP